LGVKGYSMRDIIFNPFFPESKQPLGAVAVNEKIILQVLVTRKYHLYNLRLLLKSDDNHLFHNLPLKPSIGSDLYQNYQVEFALEKPGLYWYYFEFDDCYGTHFLGATGNLDGAIGDSAPAVWQLSIYEPFVGDFRWFQGRVMYQIMVDRFHKGDYEFRRSDAVHHDDWDELPVYTNVLNNDFFGGNLQGIIEKLPYLKSLNVSVIYLNPIFEAYSNHKYDTADYTKIDPMFGRESDFRELIQKAAQCGIKIVLDGVFNHSGDNSVYFNRYGKYPELGAYQSKDSKYYSWYHFTDHPDGYRSWWGIKTLPAFNQDELSFLNFITGKDGVIRKWLELGAAGFRLDVIDELNDGFIARIYNCLKEHNPDNILIGEVWEDASNKISYGQRRQYFNGRQIDSVMNYPLRNAIIAYLTQGDALILQKQIRQLVNNYPKPVLDSLMNILGTHDTERIISVFSPEHPESKAEQANYRMDPQAYSMALSKVKLASALQYTLPGVPCLYYGDEIGTEGFRDPFCRKTFAWDKMNHELLDWYRKLGEIRKDEVYIDGLYLEEFINNDIFSFSRSYGQYKIMTIVNNGNNDYYLDIPGGYNLLTDELITGQTCIPQNSVVIIKVL
jgi:cyclomaltodextrinase